MAKLFSKKSYSVYHWIVDLFIVYASILISYFLFKNSLEDFQDNYYAFITISPYIGIAYILLSHIFELNTSKDFTIFGVTYSVTLTIVCLFFITMALSFMARVFAYPRSILLFSSFLQIVLLTPWHLYLNKRHLRHNINKTSIIIGYEKANDIVYKLLRSKGLTANIKYICSPQISDLEQRIEECEIVFISEDTNREERRTIIEFCLHHKKAILFSPRFNDIFLLNSTFTQIEDYPIFEVKPLKINASSLFIKRSIDIILSLVALIIFAIPFVLICICLKIGGGSVFYRQERVTKHGRIFNIIKFRTMVENAEALSGPVLAQQTDSRITKIGNFLRATRLDETPQIFNILKGDMSIVGPRPERPFFVEQFKKEIPEYELRQFVKAGLTGMAQVQGKYNTSVRDKLKYDLMYINNYSIPLDIKLIMQTLNILLRKDSTEGVRDNVGDIDEFIKKVTITNSDGTDKSNRQENE